MSRRNSLRHGMCAEELLLPNESMADFRFFWGEMMTALDPWDHPQAVLADMVTRQAWRLRRIMRIEVKYLSQLMLEREQSGEVGPMEDELTAAFVFDAKNGDFLGKVTRHETSAQKLMFRALIELQQLKRTKLRTARRPKPAPARPDEDEDEDEKEKKKGRQASLSVTQEQLQQALSDTFDL